MAPPNRSDAPWTLLYDADCGFCRWALASLLALDRDTLVRPLALQAPAAKEMLADLDPARRGGRVPAALLAATPRTTERAYRWVADHRSTLSRAVPSRAKARATARIARHGAASTRA